MQTSLSHATTTDAFTTKILEFADLVFGPEPLSRELLNLIGLFVLPKATPPASADEAYGRHVLYSTPDLEIMLAQWRPNHECAPHDHGFASGRVVALAGVFRETAFKFDPQTGLSEAAQVATDGEPQVFQVDQEDVHSMVCLSEIGGLTLHFYRPAISSMRVFDRERRQIFEVTGDCGAWLPRADQIISLKNWE